MDPGLSAAGRAPQVRVFDDSAALAAGASALLAEIIKRAADVGSMARIALSGGHTPGAMYDRLAGGSEYRSIPWGAVQVFFSDERFVPLDSPESNYRLAKDRLLSRVPIPERFVHPVPTEGVSETEAASMYEEGIRRVFEVGEGVGDVPQFDLIFLGLGPDGHTASLFPDTDALGVTDRLVVANYVPRLQTWRVTFTYLLLNAAKAVAFLVQGEDKADQVAAVLGGNSTVPAALVRPARLLWLLDRAAASRYPAAAGPTGPS